MKISELLVERRRKAKTKSANARKKIGRRAGPVYTGWGWPGYSASEVSGGGDSGGGGDGGGG